jgi:hypothetical protein
MLSFDSLRYYSLPPLPADYTFPIWFRVELGILAGRLYGDPGELDLVARYLRPTSEVTEIGSGDAASLVGLADDPAAFMLEWLTLRRKAQDVLHTPMGQICMGRTLE